MLTCCAHGHGTAGLELFGLCVDSIGQLYVAVTAKGARFVSEPIGGSYMHNLWRAWRKRDEVRHIPT